MIAVEADNISKKYYINEYPKYLLLRERLRRGFGNLFNLNNSKTVKSQVFYALENINFTLRAGTVMGVIGLNGAGKSTLLKILSRITPPSSGQAIINGRVASLLEVGTGFHPELTGRENIYLNGAILGMNKQEIDRLFDKIVDFSGVSKFLDTPVKRYSSGMFVRLAFSVAAHIQPEILLIDEVLAVGDIEFQKKCLGRMDDIARNSGKTIIFVSHNMSAIKSLCDECLLLENGKVNNIGETDLVVDKYLQQIIRLDDLPLSDRKDRKGSGELVFTDILLKDMNGNTLDYLQSGKDAQIWIKYDVNKDIDDINISLAFNTYLENHRVATINNKIIGKKINPGQGEKIIKIIISDLALNEEKYYLTLYADYKNQILDWVKNAKIIEVKLDQYFNYKNTKSNKGTTLLKYDFVV